MKTIMIIDDKTNIIEEVKESLKQEDFELITAENNRKALKLIEEDKENKYGLILIDTSMPDTKTPAFFSIKPKSNKNIDTSKKEDFLQKPFTKEQLLNFIKSKI
jgi:DNA-binding NtrC family response regulator